jgi:hypothetical protein
VRHDQTRLKRDAGVFLQRVPGSLNPLLPGSMPAIDIAAEIFSFMFQQAMRLNEIRMHHHSSSF